MAQLNLRLSDEDKAISEKVALDAGMSLSEYLGSIVAYISEHKTLPVVIRFKSESLTPDVLFQQAIVKARDTYMSAKAFYDFSLKIGEMTPIDDLKVVLDDISATEHFYDEKKNIIAMAPSQLERNEISDVKYFNFSICNEYFPSIIGALKKSIRMVYMNNRVVTQSDIDEGRQSLNEALDYINKLQQMINGDLSAESQIMLLLLDVSDALSCAHMATSFKAGSGNSAWLDRMKQHVSQVTKQIEKMGITSEIDEFLKMNTNLLELISFVSYHIKGQNSPIDITQNEIYLNINEVVNKYKNTLMEKIIM